ncbi:cytochrome-c peroxidase [Rhodocytophaga rosea]|uniref:cytochrome-c peroxidase n=1 Tax=Rhodocytophaga rosea TaxID=2704465 RepID=UPI001E29047C|nr:cytochrome-c peroxidase [Rhodocytophaga rosea]
MTTIAIIACNREKAQSADEVDTAEAILEEVSALPETFISPEDNPATPQKIELGRLLFYDPILSGAKDVACASCHHPEYGYAESQEVSIGVNGIGLGEMRTFKQPNTIPFGRRNAHTILNTAFNGIDPEGNYDPQKAPMFWDLRVESLENQSLEPIKNLEEMRGHSFQAEVTLDTVVNRLRSIPAYKQLFSEVFTDTEAITAINISKALAAFERSLLANNSRFDQYMRGDEAVLSSLEKEGFTAFLKSGCATCHNGPMFSDFKLHVLGVVDNEKVKVSDAGANNTYAFRTPTLRNLRYTDPYMHSGKLKTLRQVLEFYEDMAGKEPPNPHVTREQLDPLAKKMRLRFKDMQAIEAFLNSLNDDTFDRKIPDSVPSGLKVGGNID